MVENEAREKIIKAAEELFARRGYDSVSVEDIREQAGISKGLIYYHFKDKKALYSTVLKQMGKIVLPGLREIVVSDQSPTEKLTTFIKRYLEHVFKEKNLIQILAREIVNTESPVSRMIIEHSRKTIEILAGIIQEGVDKGEYRAVNPMQAAISLFGMLNIYVTAAIIFAEEIPTKETDQFSVKNLAEINTDIFLRGLQKC